MDGTENTGTEQTADVIGSDATGATDATDTTPAAPEQPAPEGEQPATPPNLSEAIAQMNQSLASIEERLPQDGDGDGDGAEDDYDFFAELTAGDEPLEDEGLEPAAAQEDQDAADQQDIAAYISAQIQKGIQEELAPHLQDLQLRDDARDIQALRERYPRLNEPEVGREVSRLVNGLAERYGNDAMRTDPALVEAMYLAFEAAAQANGQTSQAPEGAGQTPAEAGGQQGATLETGAGPGAPTPKVDPIEDMYNRALAGSGPSSDLITG